MPKVYTRAVISSSDQVSATQSSRAVLRSYYCLCGDFLLVLQGKLERLPRRKTDGSYIIRSQSTPTCPARKFKLNAIPGQRVLLKRNDDVTEIRQPFLCNRCKTPVAYQSPPPPAGSGQFLYVFKGAMTELQGRVPPDAFDGEIALEEGRWGVDEKSRRGEKGKEKNVLDGRYDDEQ